MLHITTREKKVFGTYTRYSSLCYGLLRILLLSNLYSEKTLSVNVYTILTLTANRVLGFCSSKANSYVHNII